MYKFVAQVTYINTESSGADSTFTNGWAWGAPWA